MAPTNKKELRRLRAQQRANNAPRDRMLRQLRENPLLGLFSPDLQGAIMSQEGPIEEIRPLFDRLLVLARRHPERVNALPAFHEVDQLRLALRKQYFAAVRTLDAGSWYDQLINRPIGETVMEMHGKDATHPADALRILAFQINGKLTEFLRQRTEVLIAKAADGVSPTGTGKDRSAAERRARQLARSTAGPRKGVNPQPAMYGKKKS